MEKREFSLGDKVKKITDGMQIRLERRIRPLFANHPTTHIACDILQRGDQAASLISNRIATSSNKEEGIKLLDDYMKAITDLNNITQMMCNHIGIKYRAPRGLIHILEEKTIGAGDNEDKKQDISKLA